MCHKLENLQVADWGDFLTVDILSFALKKAYVVCFLAMTSIITKVLNQNYVGLRS
jgi:hypothetical protein